MEFDMQACSNLHITLIFTVFTLKQKFQLILADSFCSQIFHLMAYRSFPKVLIDFSRQLLQSNFSLDGLLIIPQNFHPNW